MTTVDNSRGTVAGTYGRRGSTADIPVYGMAVHNRELFAKPVDRLAES